MSAELLERARALRPHLLERQAETEQRGCYSEETHALLRDAGFYSMLVPGHLGGLEVDLAGFLGVVMELARGCPASAWCTAGLAGSAVRLGAVFDGSAQAELFRAGDVRCASAPSPAASATRTEGGWILDGTFQSCVGARFATHVLGRTLANADGAHRAPTALVFVAPRSQLEVLDDPGDPVGVRGSGSQSVRFEGARIADSFARLSPSPVEGEGFDAAPDPWMTSALQAGLAAVFVGAAQTAVEIYEALVRSEPTAHAPIGPRQLDPDYQRWLGAAAGRATAAEQLLSEAAEQYVDSLTELGDAVTVSRVEDLRLGMLARESMKLASSAVEDVLRTAGPAAPHHRAQLDRIGRVVLSGWGDPSNLPEEWVARQLARHRLGLPLTV